VITSKPDPVADPVACHAIAPLVPLWAYSCYLTATDVREICRNTRALSGLIVRFSVIHPVLVLGCRSYIIAMTGHLTSGAE
jgi:hypothetical protein